MTDPLVEALETRLHRIDLIGWAQVTMRAEELELSFGDLRLLLALMIADGPSSVSELARLSGFSLDGAYPAVQRLRVRGYVREEQRRYSLSEAGQELSAVLGAAHREGIQAYIDGLDEDERSRLENAVQVGGPS